MYIATKADLIRNGNLEDCDLLPYVLCEVMIPFEWLLGKSLAIPPKLLGGSKSYYVATTK